MEEQTKFFDLSRLKANPPQYAYDLLRNIAFPRCCIPSWHTHSVSYHLILTVVTMKSVAALALLAGSAAAFAPQQQGRASTSVSAFDDALGVQQPLGFWYVRIGVEGHFIHGWYFPG